MGDATGNLWFGLTTNNYDGNLNMYDPVNNPEGPTYNTTMFQNTSTTGFTAAQITFNNSLPKTHSDKRTNGSNHQLPAVPQRFQFRYS